MNFGDQLKEIENSQAGFKFAGGDIGSIISSVLNYTLTFAGIALLIYFVWGGFQLFTSGGDQKKVSEGKATITNSLIGFVIVFVAFWIVQLVGRFLGLETLFGPDGIF